MYYTFKKLSCLAQLARFSSKLSADMYQVGSIRIVHSSKRASFIVPFSMAHRGALIHSVLLPGSLLCSPIARLRKHSSASLVLIAIRRPLSYDVALNNFLIFKCLLCYSMSNSRPRRYLDILGDNFSLAIYFLIEVLAIAVVLNAMTGFSALQKVKKRGNVTHTTTETMRESNNDLHEPKRPSYTNRRFS